MLMISPNRHEIVRWGLTTDASKDFVLLTRGYGLMTSHSLLQRPLRACCAYLQKLGGVHIIVDLPHGDLFNLEVMITPRFDELTIWKFAHTRKPATGKATVEFSSHLSSLSALFSERRMSTRGHNSWGCRSMKHRSRRKDSDVTKHI